METFTSIPSRSLESTQQDSCDLTSDELQRLQQQRKLLFSPPSGAESPKQQEESTSSYIQQLLKTSCPSTSSESSTKPSLYTARTSHFAKTNSTTVQPSLYGWMLNSGTWKGHYTHRRRRWGHHLGQDFRALQSIRYSALYRRSALGSCSSLYRPTYSSQLPPPLLPLQASEGHSAADILGKVPPPLLPLSEDSLQEAAVHQYSTMSKSRLASSVAPSPYTGMAMTNPRLCESSHLHLHQLSDATTTAGGGSGGGYLDSPQSSHYAHHATCQTPQGLQPQLHPKWQYQPYPTSRPDQRCCDRLCPLRHCQQPSSHLYSLHGTGGSRSTAACSYSSSHFDLQRPSMVNMDLQSQTASHLSFTNGPGVPPPPPPSMHEELAKGLPSSHLHCRH